MPAVEWPSGSGQCWPQFSVRENISARYKIDKNKRASMIKMTTMKQTIFGEKNGLFSTWREEHWLIKFPVQIRRKDILGDSVTSSPIKCNLRDIYIRMTYTSVCWKNQVDAFLVTQRLTDIVCSFKHAIVRVFDCINLKTQSRYIPVDMLEDLYVLFYFLNFAPLPPPPSPFCFCLVSVAFSLW